MDTRIKAVIQKPGEISEIISIDSTIEAFNRTVGGASARVALGVGRLFLVINPFLYLDSSDIRFRSNK